MRDLVDELLQAQVKARLFGGDGAVKLGRLAVVARLGRGAMGTVFAAYDPQLDRRVAVKMVEGGEAAVEEARALARLSHPNVVAVHDVIADADGVRIVMELAPGIPLRAWMAAKRPWRDVVGAMRQVAAGIAAAHAAGVVHRDIKPDNILVGDDRVRLVDFGLVGASGAAGTPAYMAPEQQDGTATAKTDQFAFGVTSFEALSGVRPQPGETKLRADAPAWVAAIVARCLAPDPAARFPDMDAVVAALSRDARRARAMGAVGLALLVGASIGALVIGRASSTDAVTCEGDASAAWNPGIAARIRDNPWGDRIAASLDHAAEAWRASYASVCRATRVTGTQSDRLLEIRTRCLDRQLERLGALATQLTQELPKSARATAVVTVGNLDEPSACETIVDDLLPEDPGVAQAWAAYQVGRYAEARVLVRDAKHADALALVGAIDARTKPLADGRASLQAALVTAAREHAPGVELEVWANLLKVELFGGDSRRVLEWEPFARAAAARAGRRGVDLDAIVGEALRDAHQYAAAQRMLQSALSGDTLRADRRALVEMNLGSIALVTGELGVAKVHLEEARDAARTELGDDHPELAIYDDKLAALARARGDLAAALTLHDESLRVRVAVFGDRDRAVATSRFHRAETLLEAGRIDEAKTELERARAVRVSAFGETSARLGELDELAAEIARASGDAAGADKAHAQAIAEDPRLEEDADGEELTIASAERTAATVKATKDRALALGLRDQWKLRTGPVDARLTLAVGDALAAVGEDATAQGTAALAALVDQPSRTRTRALAMAKLR